MIITTTITITTITAITIIIIIITIVTIIVIIIIITPTMFSRRRQGRRHLRAAHVALRGAVFLFLLLFFMYVKYLCL